MELQAPHLHIHKTRAPRALPGHACLFLSLSLLLVWLLALAARSAPLNAQGAADSAHLRVSEVLPNPQAVPDSGGEWVELFNPGPGAVNLIGWQVRAGSGYSATLPYDAWIDPGSYAILAELPGALENGGVAPLALLPGLTLEDEDSLALLAPNGSIVENAAWGSDPAVLPGRSLERTAFGDAPTWAVATQRWPGSAGDWGSPGAPYAPPPTPAPPPPLRLSEIMADPAAVDDDAGEWVELYNPNAFAVALDGWWLVNAQGGSQLLDGLALPAAARLVLGRSAQESTNGGVSVQALLTVQLANAGGALSLLAPGDTMVDSVTWDEAEAGRSLERLDGTVWRSAVQPWPGSAGDWGSPGAPSPPEPPTPAPTPLPTPPPPLPATWPLPAAGALPSPLQIDEVGYRGGDDEYIVLINSSAQPQALAGWQLGDAAHPADAEAMAALPAAAIIPAGGAFVVARAGAAFAAQWLAAPDAQFEPGAANAPTLAAGALGPNGRFALDDAGDEVLLLNPDGVLADAVCFGEGDCAALGLRGRLDAGAGASLQRVPGPDFQAAPDVRERWAILPAAPLAPLPWPTPAPHAPIALPGGFSAYWGVLDVQSTLSQGGALPPRALLASAAAQGLDFVALGDPEAHAPMADAPLALLPAWGWEADGARALVFSAQRPDLSTWPAGLADRDALLPYLHNLPAPIFWRAGAPPALDVLPNLAALAATGLASAADAPSLLALWRAAGGPLIPVGGTDAGPRYTGLAATSAAPAALAAALAARRGWLSSDASLWLVLSADDAGVWMGGALPPANSVPLTVRAGDLHGAPLHVTLWQDGAIVAEADVASGAAWTHTLLAAPGAFFFATAARADGGFALSAPIYVAAPPLTAIDNAIRIVEVLPHPTRDWDGDGISDSNDEFITLANHAAQPVALAGWQLFDSRTADNALSRFTFGQAHVIPAQGMLRLWRSETHIVLNDGSDHLYLFLPGGGLADEVAWQDAAPDMLFARAAESMQLQPAQVDASMAPSVAAAAASAAPQTDTQPPSAAAVRAPAPSSAAESDGPPRLAAAPAADVETARAWGIHVEATLRGVVILPPGLIHSTLYIAQAGAATAPACGPGLRIFLPVGDFPPLAVGDVVLAHGQLTTFRGERELRINTAADIYADGTATPPQPLATQPGAIGEALEGRLVRFSGRVAYTDGDSLYLDDPAQPAAPPVRVMVARSLGWPRPLATPGQRWRVTGIVSQMARAAPWNDGYRVLVRWPADLEISDN